MVEFCSQVLRVFIMTINNKSERNYRGKCLGWPITSYGGGYVQDSLSSRLSVSKALGIQFSPSAFNSFQFLFSWSCPGTVCYGVQLARGFPPGCKWTYGEVFHPAVVPRSFFNLIQLAIQFFGAVCYLDCILRFYDVDVSFSLFLNKPSAWLEASRTQGLCVFLLGQTEISPTNLGTLF